MTDIHSGEVSRFEPVPDHEVENIGIYSGRVDGHINITAPKPMEIDFVAPTWDSVLASAKVGIAGPMRATWKKWKDCTACSLHGGRQQVVLGSGNPSTPKYLLWGEGPGEEEDQNGGPFIGRTGQLLSSMLNEVGINRVTDCYLGNAVCCRPAKNRTPEREELLACRPRLQEQMGILLSRGTVRVVVLIGKPAFVTFMKGKELQRDGFNVGSVPIGRNLGWVEQELLPKGWPRVYTVYHPSYIARLGHNPAEMAAWKADWEAIRYWADEGILLDPRK